MMGLRRRGVKPGDLPDPKVSDRAIRSGEERLGGEY
jgi:hypothetical protein